MSQFSEDLFECTSNMGVCLFGCCVPLGFVCQQIAAVSKSTGEGYLGSCCLWALLIFCACPCIAGAVNRGKIRLVYRIEGGFLNDCLTWTFCCPCAGCQEYREVNRRTVPQQFI